MRSGAGDREANLTQPDPDFLYREYRSQQLGKQIPGVAMVLLLVSSLFVAFVAVLSPSRLYDQRWNLPFLLVAPGACWLISRYWPFWTERHPYLLSLVTDATYTLGVVSALLVPSTPTSGTALFVAVKMFASAMLVPWHPTVQAASSLATLSSYWALLLATDRVVVGSPDVAHQLTGPLFAALISIVAGMRADSLRRSEFDHAQRSEAQARVNARFAAIMSHELRNLLSAILGYNDLIREDLGQFSKPETRHALERQAALARQSLEVIGVTLELSRGASAVSTGEEPIDTLSVLEELLSEYAMRPLPPGVQLRWDLSPDLPPTNADAVKLKMILRNLIDNGLKFTPQGEVRVRARPLLEELVIEVCDTGIGIPPEQQPFIFEPFHQTDPSAAGRGGVGLGLYVANRLAEMLEGSLTVQSEVGKGTCFELRIPRAMRSHAEGTELPQRPV